MKMMIGNVVVMAALVSVGWCIKCQVGVNDKAAEVDCSGSANQMLEKMKTALGGSWSSVQESVTTGANGTLDAVKSKFGDLLNGALSGAGNIKEGLSGLTGGRRKRNTNTEDEEGIRRKRAEDSAAEPEPEPANTSGYVCMKQVKKDGTIMRSCLTKSLASMACKHVGEQGDVCFCEDKDNCNSANFISINIGVIAASILLFKLI